MNADEVGKHALLAPFGKLKVAHGRLAQNKSEMQGGLGREGNTLT